jgi:hypothetical protein
MTITTQVVGGDAITGYNDLKHQPMGLPAVSMSNPSLMVRIWPDDTWVLVEDFREGEWAWKSDDYHDVDIYDHEAFSKLDFALRIAISDAIMGET